ncbi:unnamed protein product [Leptosia nina]|uniref:Glycerate kinase n=1 Tax=Leptosia nina TaxID=320188 RepID=A0AAV1IZ85_9NEOP
MSKCTFDNLIKIFKTSFSAVLPEQLIRNSLKYNLHTEQLSVLGHHHSLKDKNVFVVGTGKAVKNMAQEIEFILGSKIKGGYLSVPVGSISEFNYKSHLKYLEGAKNNLPDKDSESTSRKVKALVSDLDKNDFLLVLISGGGSALLPLPKTPITLLEKTNLIKNLANAGADIKELNTVRKQISDLKGGQLAIQAHPAQIVSLILSDIVGDPLDLIASGPTVQNQDSPNAAIDVLKKYCLFENIPTSIKQVIEKTDSDVFPVENVHNYVIGSNKISINAAVNEAKSLNYTPIVLSHSVIGNVKDVAEHYYEQVKTICNFSKGKIDASNMLPHLLVENLRCESVNNICLIAGGETTVEVKGTGTGGRNQQLALEFSMLLHENKEYLADHEIFFLSAGTDGIDGPTDAAGALGYIHLVSDSELQGLNIRSYMDNNDSYNFYKQFSNGQFHIMTGHTNTNVMDIHLILIRRK